MKRRIITGSVLLLSIALLAIGLMKHQNIDVLNKAIRICLECIGIG